MNLKSVFLCLILLCSISILTAQEVSNYVDFSKTNGHIAYLEIENNNHSAVITDNIERKSLLENRIQTSEGRMVKIKENLEYTNQTNLELNELNKESRDRATKEKLEDTKNELFSIIWILNSEMNQLSDQNDKDKNEVIFLTKDSARRKSCWQIDCR